MKKVYLIGSLTVTNPEGFAKYPALSKPIAESFGGKYLVRGSASQLEGTNPGERHAVVEFPSREAAEAFYYSPEYQKIIHHRKNNTVGYLVLADAYELDA